MATLKHVTLPNQHDFKTSNDGRKGDHGEEENCNREHSFINLVSETPEFLRRFLEKGVCLGKGGGQVES